MTSDGHKSPSESRHSKKIRKLKSERFGRYFLLIMVVAIVILFTVTIKTFLLPILLAAVFTTLFYPMYLGVQKSFGNRSGLASFVCCLMLFIGMMIPLYILFNLVIHEAIDFYQTAEKTVKAIMEQGDKGPLGRIQSSQWFKRLYLDRVNWQAALQDFAKTTGGFLALVITKTSGGLISIVVNVFVTLFIIFYFFRDGEKILTKLRELLPLNKQYQDILMSRFATVSRATIKGGILIGVIQSSIGALTLWIFGVPSPLLWFFIMVILSMIPLIGAWMILHPAAIIQVLAGNVWQGVGIFLVTIIVISNIDNVLRPRVVGKFSGLHDLLIFFSVLGGIQVFGALGIIAGPIIAAFFVAILEIYNHEFRSNLQLSQRDS
jgi:predicted PurR-regulated permease PerM